MITVLRLLGVFMLILVGYHYINEPVGFSVPGSIATSIFALCLTTLYSPYMPEAIEWLGWGLIICGCLFMSVLGSLSWLWLLPITMILIGYRLAGLPFSLHTHSSGNGAGSVDIGGSFGGDGGGGD